MARVTALRPRAGGSVAVEVDGAPWRVVPAAAVIQAGLAVGVDLDRPALRVLRRALRRRAATDVAGRALRARDRSRRDLEVRLERAAVPPDVRTETLAMLERVGLVDDARFAANRADALARRGYGDAAIAEALEREGVLPDERSDAIAALEPELERARSLVRSRGNGPRTARFLAGKGFGEDAIAEALGRDFAPDG
jgi:SOS response regulatory protein OraA/RecX